MTAKSLRIVYSLIIAAIVASSAVVAVRRADAAQVTVSYHKNSLATTRQVGSEGIHGGVWAEQGIDLLTPECTSESNCPHTYFRYQGLNQFYAYYTMSSYTGSCAGRVVTVTWWNNAQSQWSPLIRLNFVHLYPMESPSYGQLAYDAVVAIDVGKIWSAETCDNWDSPHLHYTRSTNYGVNGINGASGFGDAYSYVGADEVVFWADAIY